MRSGFAINNFNNYNHAPSTIDANSNANSNRGLISKKKYYRKAQTGTNNIPVGIKQYSHKYLQNRLPFAQPPSGIVAVEPAKYNTRSLVEFFLSGLPTLGVIENIKRKDIYQVRTSTNSVHILNENEFTYVWGNFYGNQVFQYSHEDLPKILDTVKDDVEKYKTFLSVAWGSYLDRGVQLITTDMLACFLYKKTTPKPHEQYVAHRLLNCDDIYFVKSHHYPGHYECREKFLVKILEAQTSESDRRVRFLHRVEQRLKSRSILLRNVLSETSGVDYDWNPKQDKEFLDSIKDFAMAESEEFLSEQTYRDILKPLGLERDSRSAFDLLVDLGVWGKFEDLNIHRYTKNISHTPQQKTKFLALEKRLKRGIGIRDKDSNLRKDFRQSGPVFAIDNSGTMEIDDSISLVEREDGKWIYIHIADPSRIVQKGDELDKMARQRFSSIYTPERTIPMFPDNLAKNIFSLLQSEENYALSFGVKLDEEGNIRDYEITPSIIDPVIAMSYAEADEILNDKNSTYDHADTLHTLSSLAKIRKQMRVDRGAIIIDMPVPDISIRKKGKHVNCNSKNPERSSSNNMVSEFMILVGEITAKFANDQQIPVLYRVQNNKSSRYDSLNLTSIFDTNFWEEMYSGKDFEFTEWARSVITRDSSVSFGAASLSSNPGVHLGLGVDSYLQATSPIRRYLDLIIHYQIKAALRHDNPPFSHSEMNSLMYEIESQQREMKTISYKSQKYWMLRFFEKHTKKRYEGLVLSIQQLLHDGSQVLVLLYDLGFKTSITMNRLPFNGELLSLKVSEVDAFSDSLVLEEA